MTKIAGLGAVVWRYGIKIDNISRLTFPPGSLKFEDVTEKKIAPGIHDVTMQFTVTWDMAHPEFRREYSKWRATLARRERKRWRRYQRQKRKGG